MSEFVLVEPGATPVEAETHERQLRSIGDFRSR